MGSVSMREYTLAIWQGLGRGNLSRLELFVFSTDFHNSFESHPSRKPFPSPNLNPTVSIRDVHSNH